MNLIKENTVSILKPRLGDVNGTEKVIFFTQEKINNLMKYKIKNDICDDDFFIYLRESGLGDSEISKIDDFLKLNYSESSQLNKIKNSLSGRNKKSNNTENTLCYLQIIDRTSLKINVLVARAFINEILKIKDPIEAMSRLYHHSSTTEYEEVSELFNEAMVLPAMELIKIVKKQKKLKRSINILLRGFENSTGEAEIILTKEVIEIIQQMQNKKKLVEKLAIFHDLSSGEYSRKIFEMAMIGPSIDIIESTEKMNDTEAFEVLQWGFYNVIEGEAEKLFSEELDYRQNLNSIEDILKS